MQLLYPAMIYLMTSLERFQLLSDVRRRFQVIAPYLTEQTRRVWAAAEVTAIGDRGHAIVAEATGMSRTTIIKAVQEIEFAPTPGEHQRRSGGGRKSLFEVDPSLLEDLDLLIDPVTRGDPESPLRWTSKSTYHLADALQQKGHTISQRSVHRLLEGLGYSLQSNRKGEEGTDHPDRDGQFQFINRRVRKFQRRGWPVISVDTDGQPDLIVPPMLEAGVNFLFPMEVAAGADVRVFQRKYPGLAMMGGIDKRALALGPAAIDAELERIRPALVAGRYIPDLDHHVPNDVSWPNFCHYASRLREMVIG